MNWITRFSRLTISNQPFLIKNQINQRYFSLFPRLQLKEVFEEEKGNETIISAKYVDSPREKYLLKPEHSGACALCSSGLDVKHTDVLILSQFVRSDGCMLPRRVTGLCRKQQRKISALVTMAQKSGLMPNLAPSYSKKDPTKRFGWKKYNKYFDESTIKT
ncbi:large ribosomal subunit protein mL66 [Onthophagus taurus]|uniref:large ribosomal subunit protein mL66 n=1 Tax=Onthophagus taurus TaxID=166361 RepID=UPI000C206DEA|nr:28S ribosomal protein S18a, mitochondrial [Onthophagus taurus]